MAPRTLAQVIEVDQGVAVGIAVLGGVLLVAGLVAWRRARKAMARRIATAALRLEASPPPTDAGGVEKNLRRLERAVDQAAVRLAETAASEARLVRAVESGAQGVVIPGDSLPIVESLGGDDPEPPDSLPEPPDTLPSPPPIQP